MSLKLDILLMLIFIVGAFVTYYLAKKYQNKKLLIPTYIFFGLILLTIIYAVLDIIIVGGI